MSVGRKINLIIGLFLAIIVLLGIVNFMSNTKVEKTVETALTEQTKINHLLAEVKVLTVDQQNIIYQMMVAKDFSLYSTLEEKQQAVSDKVKALQSLDTKGTMTAQLAAIAQDQKSLEAFSANIHQNRDTYKLLELAAMTEEKVLPLLGNISEQATLAMDKSTAQFTAGINQVDNQFLVVTIVGAVIIALAIFIGVPIMVFVRRTISRPLEKLGEVTEEIANGNLLVKVPQVKTKDEIGQLSRNFEKMCESLRSLLQQIQSSSEVINSSSTQVDTTVDALSSISHGVSTQIVDINNIIRAAVEASAESSMAMEETSIGMQRIAESTHVLNESAAQANDMASEGSNKINNVNMQMNDIQTSTGQVHEVVNRLATQIAEIQTISATISSITEQTNLLALNASIEAARAGEYGKGFAVVADEVRKLAEQSNDSAAHITTLIREIQQDTKAVEQAVSESLETVAAGKATMLEADEAFSEIVKAVNKMTDEIGGISAAAEEISASAEQVTASVQQIASSAEIASSNSEDIMRGTEEQTSQLTLVETITKHLKGSAQMLSGNLVNFKI